MKRNRKRQILNCIVPDPWIVKAVSASLGDGREELGLRGRKYIKVTCPYSWHGNGQWVPSQLRPRSYSPMGDPRCIWIRLMAEGPCIAVQHSMQGHLNRRGIPFAIARVRVMINGISRTWHYGVVVDIEDATEALLAMLPGLLEDRRALVYNRDEPEL